MQPISADVIKTNIDFLAYLKDAAFKGNHPGIDKMVKEMTAELRKRGNVKQGIVKTPSNRIDLLELSFVNGNIKSQWQAHFAQIFPIGMDSLPKTHPSDEKFFNKHWKGPKMSYDEFVSIASRRG